jgi:hypothetical protein
VLVDDARLRRVKKQISALISEWMVSAPEKSAPEQLYQRSSIYMKKEGFLALDKLD